MPEKRSVAGVGFIMDQCEPMGWAKFHSVSRAVIVARLRRLLRKQRGAMQKFPGRATAWGSAPIIRGCRAPELILSALRLCCAPSTPNTSTRRWGCATCWPIWRICGRTPFCASSPSHGSRRKCWTSCWQRWASRLRDRRKSSALVSTSGT